MADKTLWQEHWAPMLIEDLVRHPKVAAMRNVDGESFKVIQKRMLNDLISLNLPEDQEGVFQIVLPDYGFSVISDGEERGYILNARRILVNDNAETAKFGLLRRLGAKFADNLGGFSSDSWVRKIRESPEVMDTLTHANCAYSLLLKHQEVDYSNPRVEEVRTSPILIVPNRSDATAIREWEARYTSAFK